jgi:hypothetical protein
MMWSSETLTAVSRLFDPLEQPEKVFIRPLQGFLQLIGKENAARITVIHLKIILTPFGPHPRDASIGHDEAGFIENHKLIFNNTLIGLKELRIAGYWDSSFGKRAFAKNHKWNNTPNYGYLLQISDDPRSNQVFFKLTKNVETFVKRLPQETSTQLHNNPSIRSQPVLWLDIIERQKMNQRRTDDSSATSTD